MYSGSAEGVVECIINVRYYYYYYYYLESMLKYDFSDCNQKVAFSSFLFSIANKGQIPASAITKQIYGILGVIRLVAG